MKLKLILIALTAMVITSCSKDVLDVEFDANYETDLLIDIPEVKIEEGAFMVSDTIDLASNKDVETYLAKIKDWDISSIEGQFRELSENFTLVNGTFSVKTETLAAEWTFNNLPITELTALVLANENGQFDIINQILLNKDKFIVTFSGTTDKKGMDFILGSKLKSKVVANPLN